MYSLFGGIGFRKRLRPAALELVSGRCALVYGWMLENAPGVQKSPTQAGRSNRLGATNRTPYIVLISAHRNFHGPRLTRREDDCTGGPKSAMRFYSACSRWQTEQIQGRNGWERRMLRSGVVRRMCGCDSAGGSGPHPGPPRWRPFLTSPPEGEERLQGGKRRCGRTLARGGSGRAGFGGRWAAVVDWCHFGRYLGTLPYQVGIR